MCITPALGIHRSISVISLCFVQRVGPGLGSRSKRNVFVLETWGYLNFYINDFNLNTTLTVVLVMSFRDRNTKVIRCIINSWKTEKVLYLWKFSLVVFYPIETIFCFGKIVYYIRAIFCGIEFFTKCRGTCGRLLTEIVIVGLHDACFLLKAETDIEKAAYKDFVLICINFRFDFLSWNKSYYEVKLLIRWSLYHAHAWDLATKSKTTTKFSSCFSCTNNNLRLSSVL